MMIPEIQAYQHALFTWERFQSESRYVPDEASLLSGTPTVNLVDSFLRLIPPAESKPAAFGLFIRFARNWSPLRQSSFLGEFLPGPSSVERRLLEAGAKGALKPPCKLPITLEEFPSRIWKRAQASGSPGRLVSAACLAFNAMINLREQHEDDTDLEDLMTFRIPSGDLPLVIDLAALPPVESHELKQRVIDRLMKELRAGRFEISTEDMPAIKAWVLVNADEGKPFIEKLAAEARRAIENYLASGSLRDHHHTRRLGRLMFRFGLRRLSSQCAKALGYSPWEIGWQHQPVSATIHSRIRKIILGPDSDSDAWMKDPALACSAMSIPLWLADGVERVSALTALFNKAEECPWIFPRLQHIYQWHLALAGKHEELRHIEHLAPDLAVGLADRQNQSIS
jgi:hypothetical protein